MTQGGDDKTRDLSGLSKQLARQTADGQPAAAPGPSAQEIAQLPTAPANAPARPSQPRPLPNRPPARPVASPTRPVETPPRPNPVAAPPPVTSSQSAWASQSVPPPSVASILPNAAGPSPRPRATVVRAIDWSSGRPLNGRYKLLNKLGEGGMGAVWLCEDVLLRRKVALKTLFADRAQIGEEDLERFRREVAIAHAVNHPNIARTYDLGESAGVHYLTMEYLEGETLVQRLKAGEPLTSAELRAIAVPLCEGLRAAHKAGVVHRDLKPANVMLVKDERRAVVMDFGIAAALDEDQSAPSAPVPAQSAVPWEVTSAGRGTPTYMAPEQWLGQRGDARTDIYALGVIFYVCLTKKVPYKAATNQELADLHQSAPVPRVESLVPGVDKDLAELIYRCLAKRPEDRPQSMGAVLDLLDRGHRRKVAFGQITIVSIGLAAMLALVGVGLWTMTHWAVVREMRPAQARLAELLALQIDVDDLAKVTKAGDEDTPPFQRVHRVMETYRKRNPEVTGMYVMRPASAPGHYTTVVDLYPTDQDRDGDGKISAEERGSLPGDDYDGTEVPKMQEVLSTRTPIADDDFTVDSWGMTLSGYAPIFKQGQPTPYFVGVDQGNGRLTDFKARLLVVLVVTWLGLTIAFALFREKLFGRR